jgi:hypothetical protein
VGDWVNEGGGGGWVDKLDGCKLKTSSFKRNEETVDPNEDVVYFRRATGGEKHREAGGPEKE